MKNSSMIFDNFALIFILVSCSIFFSDLRTAYLVTSWIKVYNENSFAARTNLHSRKCFNNTTFVIFDLYFRSFLVCYTDLRYCLTNKYKYHSKREKVLYFKKLQIASVQYELHNLILQCCKESNFLLKSHSVTFCLLLQC